MRALVCAGALGLCMASSAQTIAAAEGFAEPSGLRGRLGARVETLSNGASARCLGVWLESVLLAPQHCFLPPPRGTRARESDDALWSPPLETLALSQAKDYALLALPGSLSQARPVRASEIAESAPRPGESLMVGARFGWIKATASSYGEGAFWALAQGCVRPGDSGAPIWTLREGSWKWAGMLVSGAPDERGCLKSLVALSASAIAWGVYYPR